MRNNLRRLILAVTLLTPLHTYAHQYKNVYADQTISTHYECHNLSIDVSAVFNANSKTFALTRYYIADDSSHENAEIQEMFTPYIKTIHGMQSLYFSCEAREPWVYIFLNNKNPWDEDDKDNAIKLSIIDFKVLEGWQRGQPSFNYDGSSTER